MEILGPYLDKIQTKRYDVGFNNIYFFFIVMFYLFGNMHVLIFVPVGTRTGSTTSIDTFWSTGTGEMVPL